MRRLAVASVVGGLALAGFAPAAHGSFSWGVSNSGGQEGGPEVLRCVGVNPNGKTIVVPPQVCVPESRGFKVEID